MNIISLLHTARLIRGRKWFLTGLCICSGIMVHAQQRSFSPLMDPAVKSISNRMASVASYYLWHPGQLSAHLQQKRLKESKERCVNVGYPGKFYTPVSKTVFKKEYRLDKEAVVTYKATGALKLWINNKLTVTAPTSIRLPKGRSLLSFEVITSVDLPALQVWVNDKPDYTHWQSSLNGLHWTFAETSPTSGSKNQSPLDDQELEWNIPPASVKPYQNAFLKGDRIIVPAGGYVLIDYYHLEMGTIAFMATGKALLTAQVGETPEEAMNGDTSKFEQFPIPAVHLTGTSQKVQLPERALRYLKVMSHSDCEISVPTFTARLWPSPLQMTFGCDDERINNIWQASVASLHTSTHGFYLDGIKRDYLPWSMDAVLSTFGGDYVLGDKQVSLNSLSVALLPLQPVKADLGIPDYPLHALIGFKQHLKRYGNFSTILSYRDRIEQLLAFYETLQDKRNFISANVGVSWGFVPGWATKRGPDRKGTPAYAQIMLYHNFRIGADFATRWGDKKASAHYTQKAEALKTCILKHFWSEEKGLFINGYTAKDQLDTGISHHAQYWAVLAGLFPSDRYEGLFKALPQIAYYKDYVSYEKGYEFMAYAKARKVKEMWQFLFEVFGDWLEQGHTRFPENFSYKKSRQEQLIFYNRPYGLSLCHGANGVPGIVGVMQGIAGFSQSDEKLNHYTFEPDLMHLKYVDVSFPVKEGQLKLQLRRTGVSTIEIPAGCTVTVQFKGSIHQYRSAGLYRF